MVDVRALTATVEPKMRRCNCCQRPYDEYGPRPIHEREFLNKALMATGPAAAEDRAICDICYETMVHSAPRLNNKASLDIGGSNCGPGNFLLQQKYGK